MQKPYNDYSSYIKRNFKERVQKIATDAGFTCPNRNGKKGRGGCTYCDNSTFKPFYCSPEKSITRQLQEGINFFSPKYKAQKYFAYFQAFSNTYASLDILKERYEEALRVDGVIGLVIGTRPDCIDDEILDYLKELSEKYYIIVEYGVESFSDKTLMRINRGHTVQDSIAAIEKTINKGVKTGIHLILGLPGESKHEILSFVDIISKYDLETLKLHQLQIIEGTAMAKEFFENPGDFTLFDVNEYIDFVVKFLERLNPEITVERFISQSPPEKLIAPKWGELKNFEIVAKIEKRFKELKTFQGRLFKAKKNCP